MEKTQTLPIMVLAGILCAGLTILPSYLPSVLTFFLVYFSFVPLFAVGLGMGLVPLYGATGVAALIIFLGSSLMDVSQFFLQALLGPVFLVNRALLYRQNKKGQTVWYPASQLLVMFSAAMGGILLFALGAYLYVTHGQDPQLYIQQFVQVIDPQGQLSVRPFFTKILLVLPGLFAVIWGAVMVLNGLVAQGILVRFKKNLRPTPSLNDIQLHPLFSVAFLGCCFVAWLGLGTLGILAANVACVLSFPLFLVGLSLCRQRIYQTPFKGPLLILFYLLLCFLWPALFVLMIGILKPWIEKFF